MLWALLLVPFLDELTSGIAPASTPDIAERLHASGGMTAAWMIVAFHSLAFIVEAPLLAWSERVKVRWFAGASIAVVALTAFAAALWPRGWALLLSLAVYGPAAGCALSAAEGALVEAFPEARERTLARLSLMANAGDLAVPILLGLLAWAGIGWRGGFVVAGLVATVLALAHASARSLDRTLVVEDAGDEVDGESESPRLRDAVRVALGARGLVGWSLASAATNLLDEVLVAFSAIHLEALGASPAVRSWAIGGWVVGGFLGLGALERWVRPERVRRMLFAAATVSGGALVVLASTGSAQLASAMLFVIGATGSTLHPLTKARTYAALPNRPGIVNAVGSALLPLEMAAPLILGLVASSVGTGWAVAGLLAAPVAVAAAASLLLRRP